MQQRDLRITPSNPLQRCAPTRAPGRARRLYASCQPRAGPRGADEVARVVADAARHLGQAALGAAAAAVLLVAPLPAAAAAVLLVAPLPAAAAARTVTFPVAERPELFAVQKTLVEAWTIISQSFVDPTFNHQDWPAQLQGELAAVAAADSPAAASAHVATMIKSLGDPYTRWVPRSEYMDFRVSSDGELKGGVGLLIASDPSSGRLVVLAPIKGSPADRAGIRPGDEVLAVDGASMAGRDGEAAARFLRGQQGSSVTVKVARRRGGADQVPGVAAGLLPRAPTVLPVEYKHFRLRREKVELSPVFATTLTRDDHAFGYVRLTQFGQHAAADMRAAIAQLTRDGAESFILDLRNNPGGLVRASLEVAALWMDGEARPTVFSVQDRQDAEEEAALVDGDLPPGAAATRGGSAAQRVVLRGGHAATVAPLVVLVNKQSASASEILAGALHDNGRAEVIGDSSTFGKGKIQSVFELDDGSAVFVTVAKYKTPAGTDIDRVGVTPDRSCAPLPLGPGGGGGGSAGPASVPGIPVGPGADARVIEELETDSCVLTAEALLEARADAAAGRIPAAQVATA